MIDDEIECFQEYRGLKGYVKLLFEALTGQSECPYITGISIHVTYGISQSMCFYSVCDEPMVSPQSCRPWIEE